MPAPRFSIITATYDPPLDAFGDTVASVLGQDYDDWEWVLVDDCSPDPAVRVRLAEVAALDPRVRVYERDENGGIVAASSDALNSARGEFVCLLDHDDVLETSALALVAETLDEHPDVDYAYSDQDRMTVAGQTHSPFRKPDWSPERLRHHMYTTHFSVLRRTLALEVGGFRSGYDGSQDHDLVLRVTERAREVRAHPGGALPLARGAGSAAGDAEAKPWAWDAGVRAVQDHLDRTGIGGRASKGRAPGTYRIEREPDLDTPVSIVIPTIGSTGVVHGAHRTMVVETVRSVLESSRHRALEFVVVYDSPTRRGDAGRAAGTPLGDAPAAAGRVPPPVQLQREEQRRRPPRHRRDPGVHERRHGGDLPRRHRASHRSSARAGRGRHRPQAAVRGLSGPARGARLRQRHHHPQLLPRAAPGAARAYGELWVNREVTALTGACIAVRRETFEEVGGFTEVLPVNYNDVDFCLKLGHTGHRLVWLHDVLLYHFESISRSNEVRPWEKRFITDRWGDYKTVEERFSINVR